MARGGNQTRFDVLITARYNGKDVDSGAAKTTSTTEKMLRDQVRATERAAKDVDRINAKTARLAQEQDRIQERSAKALANEKQRIIKREQDAFLRAEKEKQDAIRKTQHAQKAAADATSSAWVTAFGVMKTVAVFTFAAIIAGATGMGFAIARAMSFDVLERGLEIVAGTAQEAQKQLTRLKELARLPGLGLREAISSSIALQIGFQQTIKNTSTRVALAEETIKQFSNAIALTGGGPEVFQRVITQLTQMSNAGKVLMTDLRPIIQAAPAIGQALVKAFGTIDPSEINALGLTTEQFMTRLNTALATLPRATDSAANAWTNFTNAFDQALIKIGKPFLEPLTKALTFLEPLLDSFGTRVGEIFTMIGQDAVKLWQGLPEMTRAQFADMLGTVEGMGGTIVKWFRDNYPLMQAVVSNVLQQIANFWKTHGEQIKLIAGHSLESILKQTTLILNLLTGDWKTAFAQIPGIIRSEGAKGVQAVVFLITLIWKALLLQKDMIKKTGEALGGALLDGITQGIKARASALLITAMSVFTPVIGIARKVFDIRSPSRVFMRMGEGLVVGLMIGMLSQQAAAVATARQIASDVVSVTEAAILNFGDPSKPVTTKKQAASQALKTEREQIQKIREELEHQVTVLREIGGEQTAVERVNALLANPNVAKRIDERTQALLRFNAALEDNRKSERQRFVNPQTRPRRVDEDVPILPGDTERSRRVGDPSDSVDLDISAAYSAILDELNGKITENVRLTAVQTIQQKLQEQGLYDLNDARVQEIVRLAQTIDQTEELNAVRERTRQVAEDMAGIFASATERWSGSFRDFFKNIAGGFSDLLRRMIGDLVQSKLTNVFETVFSKIFGGGKTSSGNGGFGSIFGRGGSTPPFAGGSGWSGSGVSSGAGISGAISSALGSLTSSPASLSAATQGGAWAEMGKRLGFPGTAAKGPLGGIGSAIGSILPMIGMSAGASLGGPSRFGAILGGAGGLLAGGIGAAFLAPGLFAAGGMFGTMGPAIAGLLTNPFTAIAAGALIIGAIILSKNAQRKKDEKTRNQATIDTRSALWQILAAVQTDQMDGNTARGEIQKLHQNWIEVGNSLKDGKTRRHHMETWNHFQPIIDSIEKEIGLQTTRANNRNRMVPVFHSGGESATSQLIKVTPGEGVKYPGSNLVSTVQGRDRGYDSEYMYAPKGTRIIPQSEMRQSRGFANGGVVGDGGSFAPNILRIDSMNIEMDGDGLAKVVIKSRHFKDAVIHDVKVGRVEKKL